MAIPSTTLITALRSTAARLRLGATHRWSNFGACNCGHLAQTITQLSADEIQARMFGGSGDWGSQAREYCPRTGYPIDHVVASLMNVGLSAQDLDDLERLSNPRVLERVADSALPLSHMLRDDAVLYIEAWACLLEEELAQRLARRKKLGKGERAA